MVGLVAVVVLGVLAVAGAVGGRSSSDRLNEALCADLDDGLTVHQIRGDTDPEDFAQRVYLAVSDECPEHENRSDVVTLLENWGYGPPPYSR